VKQKLVGGLGLVCMALTLAGPVFAQGNMTIEFRLSKVRHLTGVVADLAGRPFPGAIVEDCDPTYNRVLASATTNGEGRFSLPPGRYGTIHYLKIRYPNFQLVHMPVTIRLFAKPELHIALEPGT
jgi:hypothetical protein